MRNLPLIIVWALSFGLTVASSPGLADVQAPVSSPQQPAGVDAGLDNLAVFDGRFPKALYFRYVAPGSSSVPSADAHWVKRWQYLDGMIVSALDDFTFDFPDKVISKVELYKATYPDKLALLHINGKSRFPQLTNPRLSPLHFLTYAGVTSNSRLEPAASSIRLGKSGRAQARIFQASTGRGGRGRDDLVITALTPAGKPDWQHFEYARLRSVNAKTGELLIERGQYGTSARHFDGYYIAPLVTSGPWRPKSAQMDWLYNYSLQSATLAGVQPVAQVLADEIGAWFASDGVLRAFDGLEFDVMVENPGNPGRGRPTDIDFNGDGTIDQLDARVRSAYGPGVAEFLRRVRAALGDGKLVLADGHRTNHQRSVADLNGIESEGWPHHYDLQLEDWSGGLNRHAYWAQFARQPRFSYVRIGELYDKQLRKVEISANLQRLMIAGAILTGSAIVPSNRNAGLPFHKWPELSGGRGVYSSWLGKPLAEPVYTATQTPNLWGEDVVGSAGQWRLNGRLGYDSREQVLRMGRTKAGSARVEVELAIPAFSGSDLVIALAASNAPINTNSGQRPRLLEVELSSACNSTQSIMSWLGGETFSSRFYFSDVKWSKGCSVTLRAEGEGDVYLRRATVHASPDVVSQQFEHGFLVANPADSTQAVTLDNAYPGCRLRPLASGAEVEVDGRSVRPKVAAKDALFVRADC
ncbi:hypothetical protein G8764_09960 [Pseudomaricurvus alcaniphilus]|uniref:hypothetical protein n=1 Tax=Pseudomaricurvus alcaniphilus TaxID=1166482 RepID=UPI00140834CF|nr:hypothetical protein [Pseudomaricurvus alcaniphilus]NHN37617.1 hypothetical protein [Pseudomaricurvus alcaniphilus]